MDRFDQNLSANTVKQIQETVKSNNLDGWLMYSFRKNNPIVGKVLNLPAHLSQMRRFFYFIPANGTPQKLVHGIERGTLDSVPGDKMIYSSWKELEEGLKKITKNGKKIAMEYSPEAAIPYVSLVDAGTIELVRKATGAEIVSSADLIQQFDSTWDDEQLELHLEASKSIVKTVHEAFAEIKKHVSAKKKITEFDVQSFILKRFKEDGLAVEHLPNCSVNENAADPHYEPLESTAKAIKEGDVVLIDLWAKRDVPRAVYADYTWMGFVGTAVPDKYAKIFEVVKGARDAAIAFIKTEINADRPLFGWQVDDVCRNFIKSKGYGEYFIHRTGHSIGEDVHGNGANIDNLETKDNRRIMPRTCFSIEPGIYFVDDFGMRTEVNVYITKNKDVLVTGTPIQQTVIPIMK
ncbi:MAG: aminopeptidase P family protein [Bacteroidetes bacterium]|nr:aminopeptidase P family protein [Bacteroidota bacterium]